MAGPVDAAVIAELFDRHAAALTFYVQPWTNSADDCVQEAFIELARQQPPPDNPAAWLYRVARNRALNASRASRRRSTHEQVAAVCRTAALTRSDRDPAETASLSDALSTLDSPSREVVVLRVWGRMSWQEIAEVVGQSKSSAQRLYVQALTQLRTIWEPKPCPTN